MRSTGRFIIFTIASVSTLPCLAGAQTSAAPAVVEADVSSSGLVDPWRDERAQPSESESSMLIDPWRDPPPSDLLIIDPWRTAPRARSMPLEPLELVDPWQDGAPHRVPTARFPLVDPWRAR